MVTALVDTLDGVEAVYRQESDRLWRALVAFAGDPDVASDAVAEAFAQAIRRGAAITDLRAWVWRTGFRLAAGELSRRHRTAAPTAATPDHGYLDPETDHDLFAALGRLPTKQRAAVILFYYDDASIRDIAQRTGMSPISVRVNLSRGRNRLKELLGESHV